MITPEEKKKQEKMYYYDPNAPYIPKWMLPWDSKPRKL